jgi:hypothetical protein
VFGARDEEVGAMEVKDALAIAVASNAAGGFVKVLTQRGFAWLDRMLESHSEAVQREVRENQDRFLLKLAGRVERLESELPPEDRHRIADALDDPDTSFLLQRACISAATSSSDDRHEILAELIAQRMSCQPDDLVALAGGAACDVVSALLPRHIRLLAFMTRLLRIRPASPFAAPDQASYDQHVTRECSALGGMANTLRDVTPLDFSHLAALSCILYFPTSERNLVAAFSYKATPERAVTVASLKSQAWWSDVERLWQIGVKHSDLTTTGQIIGVLRYDCEMKTRTSIQW